MSTDKKVKRVQEILSKNSKKMIEELEKIALFKNHPDTELLEFEIHDLESIILYPMTKEADQVCDKNMDCFVGYYKIQLDIRSILREYLDELNENFDEDYYNEIVKSLIEWFSDCWDHVKGKISLSANISLHDSIDVFDLDNKKWRESGYQYN